MHVPRFLFALAILRYEGFFGVWSCNLLRRFVGQLWQGAKDRRGLRLNSRLLPRGRLRVVGLCFEVIDCR